MARRKMQIGTCRICKEEKELSFEHIPPKVAFNKHTKYRTAPFEEILNNGSNPDYKPKTKLKQGGVGYYCLCRDCNSFLGQTYVPDFFNLVNIGRDILDKVNPENVHFTANNQSPLKILKQIISMFICINEPWFTKEYHELLTFVKNPENQFLPDKYRVYMYLNNEGQIRNHGWMVTNIHGTVSEITFPPFGYVLRIGEQNPIVGHTEITNFKSISFDENRHIEFKMRKFPTYSPIPLDYRSRSEYFKT